MIGDDIHRRRDRVCLENRNCVIDEVTASVVESDQTGPFWKRAGSTGIDEVADGEGIEAEIADHGQVRVEVIGMNAPRPIFLRRIWSYRVVQQDRYRCHDAKTSR